MELYLINTVTNGRDNVMEYRMVERKKDMRTKFCRENKDTIISPIVLARLISKYDIQVKDNRVIMQNGEIAYKFGKELKESKRGLKMNYNELIDAIVNEYGNDSYNVKKVLENEITNMVENNIFVAEFEMYNKKFEIIREVIFLNDEEYEEKFSYIKN